MKYRTRSQYTETDKALMWERWRQATSQPRSEFQISNIPDVDALGGSTEGLAANT
jgi:hypothetical protein